MLNEIIVLGLELADNLFQIAKLFGQAVLQRVDTLLLTRDLLVDAINIGLDAVLPESQGAVKGADEIIHGIGDAFADAVLNQREEITDARRVRGQGVGELAVVNGQRAVFLKGYADIGEILNPGPVPSGLG